jgi:hypothetical protein
MAPSSSAKAGLLADSFAAALRSDHPASEVVLFPPPRTADAKYR